MLSDGLYGLSYRAQESGEQVLAEGLAVLRAGQILGSDPWGAVFTGSCWHDLDHDVSLLRVRLDVPPFGELVTGHAAGPEGRQLDIEATFSSAEPGASAVVDVAGRPLAVELRFLGPIPA